MKKIYTTGEVAKLLGININTVIKWFDEGKINGFRLPGSRERRITHSALVTFMQTNGIPLDLIGDSPSMQERRAVPRYPTNIPVSLMIDNQTFDAQVTNISESGALIALPISYADHVRLGNFSVNLDFVGKPLNGLSTTANIANVRPNDNTVGLGVRFNSDNSSFRARVREAFSA